MREKKSFQKTSAGLVLLLCSIAGFAVGPCQFTLVGDFNSDCIVDMDDLAVFASGWLTDWSGQAGAFLPPGIFVTPPEWGGSDWAGCGSILDPCATISQGMYRAQSMGYSYVYVSDGIYSESLTVIGGINLWGGFNPATWIRGDLQLSNTVVTAPISGGHVKTVVAYNILNPTEISGFVIQGAEATAAGKNSYAVWIRDCDSDFVLEQNYIYAGCGANGSDGTDGTDGVQGVDGVGASGVPDKDYDAFITTSSPCSSANNRQYDNGGKLTYEGDDISGGTGGGNQCAPIPNSRYSGIEGTAGQSSTSTGGGTGGAAGYTGYDGTINVSTCYLPPYPMTGENGLAGSDGLAGTGGIGAADGQGILASYEWVGVWGSSGTSGGNGGGGGGGGAGGGSDAIASPYLDRLGAHGGGGGSGGAGGKGGGGGGAGGGCFGIFVANTIAGSNHPTLLYNTVIPGCGGDGGNGGFGGKGMQGGNGGPGGSCPDNCLCYSSAGDGGNGGAGGHGGGGGGGAGGVSYGIYTWNVTPGPNYHLTNIFTGTCVGGIAGKGGKSLGNDGTYGTAGAAANYIYD